MQLTAGNKYLVLCLKHMFARGVTLSYGKIGVKIERPVLASQIHLTLDKELRLEISMLFPKSQNQQFN
tara:strand:+ start:35 stop:238 length:204 start_codon:yes stop_codon:yes gene_type:complete